jgi:hypothetical protein
MLMRALLEGGVLWDRGRDQDCRGCSGPCRLPKVCPRLDLCRGLEDTALTEDWHRHQHLARCRVSVGQA